MEIQGVIFDLGHTLMDFQGEWEEVEQRGARALFEFLRQNGYEGVEEAVDYFLSRRNAGHVKADHSLVEYTAESAFQEMLRRFNLNGKREGLTREALEAYFFPELESWRPRSDSVKVLKNLKKKGYLVGLISNATHSPFVQNCLKKFEFASYLDPVIASASFRVRKPHPDIFKHVADHWGMSPGQIAMVGDQLYFDVYGAHQAGMKGVWYEDRSDKAYTYIPAALKHDPCMAPDKTIHSLEEILDWLP